MSFRKVVFWIHLIAGVISGLVIGIMCFTGTALAFEKQLVAWSERDARQIASPVAGQTRLPIDVLTQRVRDANPDARPASIVVSSNPTATVAFSLGRDQTVFVNPYTGEILRPASTAMHDVMHVFVEWHRFLSLTDDQRPVGKVINGACNLAFFALAVSGLYLWIPRTWSRRGVRAIALFNWKLAGKARDFNWHNVIGLWSAPILIILTLTAVPISFRWGNALVYRLVGEEPPVQAGPGAAATPAAELEKPPAGTAPLGRQDQFAAIQKAFPKWEQITLRLAAPGRGGQANQRTAAVAGGSGSTAPREERATGPQPVTFVIKQPGTWPRTATTTAVMNPYTGAIVRQENFADQSTGRQIRSWTRFLHTGEALGWIGQAIAGLACLGGCFLVYTGFALAWRRFFVKAPANSES